jgi:GDP-L-fucose synthase
MNKDSKIFVAGASGLVGSAITRALLAAGYKNLIGTYHTHRPDFSANCQLPAQSNRLDFVQLDLSRQSDTETFFEKERPEYVFLAAAKVGGIFANTTYKADFIYDNLVIASNVIHAAHKIGVKKLLNLGSSCIYPKLCPQPMKEEYLLTGSLEPTNEPYAIAKIAAIKLCRYYNEQYGTNFISVMPTNLYGPNDNFDLETSHVLPALIRKFHLAKLLSQGDFNAVRKDFMTWGNRDIIIKKRNVVINGASPVEDILSVLNHFGICGQLANSRLGTQNSTLSASVELWGSGEPYREFLHVDDCANACILLMESYGYEAIGEFVNIGSGEDRKIRELAEMVREVVGFDGDVRWDRTKPDGTPKKLLDVSKLKAIGWKPGIELQEGVTRTYDWYCSQNSA